MTTTGREFCTNNLDTRSVILLALICDKCADCPNSCKDLLAYCGLASEQESFKKKVRKQISKLRREILNGASDPHLRTRGRPLNMSPADKELTQERIMQAVGTPATIEEKYSEFQTIANKKRGRGPAVATYGKVKKFKRDLGLSECKYDPTTAARDLAVQDPRNRIALILALEEEIVRGDYGPSVIVNWDATTSYSGKWMTPKVVTLRGDKTHRRAIPPKVTNTLLPMKVLIVTTAGGNVLPPLVNMKVPSLLKEEVSMVRIPGLTPSPAQCGDMNCNGYLMLSQSGAFSSVHYKTYIRNVLMPWAKKAQGDFMKEHTGAGADAPLRKAPFVRFFMDGDVASLQAIREMEEELIAARIIPLKFAANTSSADQPNDKCHGGFKLMKGALTGSRRKPVKPSGRLHKDIDAIVRKALIDTLTTGAAETLCDNIRFSVKALADVFETSGCFSPAAVKKSWEGLYPYDWTQVIKCCEWGSSAAAFKEISTFLDDKERLAAALAYRRKKGGKLSCGDIHDVFGFTCGLPVEQRTFSRVVEELHPTQLKSGTVQPIVVKELREQAIIARERLVRPPFCLSGVEC